MPKTAKKPTAKNPTAKKRTVKAKATIPNKPTEIARRIDISPVHDEMRDSFMPYALSVTTARAIPDVRDGLKPVQRRILFAMNDLGLRPGEPFRKSAAVVGEVMGKYHPHGDSAIYEAMVRMGQPFAMSQTLVDPKGNFGSLDDPPAAYRYTEARLTAEAITLVSDIEEDTVDFVANFDGERVEPTCLPAALPNLLVNGASGIAVGMATSMAPHNLAEVAAAIKLVLTQRRPKPTIAELMKHLPAPDFPNGALIVQAESLLSVYETGKGTVRVRARAEVEHATATRERIVVTELPYMVGPERVLTKIRELILAGKLPGVSSVTDLSDRNHGLRLVIECRPGVGGRGVLRDLFRLTPLEDNFNINNVTLVNGVPTTVGLYELCQHYIDHRLDVIVRRTQYRLTRANERSHIVEGLLKALAEIDAVIKIIRGSADVPTARAALISKLAISEIQANHILDLQLRRLTALEVSKLEEELAELQAAIKRFEKLLKSDAARRTLLRKELDELVENFGTPRRSSLISEADVAAFDDLAKADLSKTAAANKSESGAGSAARGSAGVGLADAGLAGSGETGMGQAGTDQAGTDSTIVELSTSGLFGRRGLDDAFNAKPGRHDLIQVALETSTLDAVYAVTDRGRLLSVAVHSIPEMVRGSRGASVSEMFSLSRGERVVGLLAAADAISGAVGAANVAASVANVTASAGQASAGQASKGQAPVGQTLTAQASATQTPAGQVPIALITRQGQAKRVERSALSSRRRVGSLINLADDDSVVAAFDAPDGADLVMIASDGQALRTAAAAFPVRGHGAGPVAGMKLKPGVKVVAAGLAEFAAMAVLITDIGALKTTDLAELKSYGRATGGAPAIKLRGDQTDPPETAVTDAWVGRSANAAALVEMLNAVGGSLVDSPADSLADSSGRASSAPIALTLTATSPKDSADFLSAGLPNADQSSADRPNADQLSTDLPSTGQPSADQSSADQPNADQLSNAPEPDEAPTAHLRVLTVGEYRFE